MNIRHPEIYQGGKNTTNYFEGWYFRHTAEDKTHSLIVIPGVSYTKNDTHAFIQVITGNPQKTYYIRFDIGELSYSPDKFRVSIGGNTFSKSGIHLELDDKDITLTADISYGMFKEIEKSFFSPNIMGYFAYIPKMECNHGVISLSHTLSGDVLFNGIKTSYENGKGYIEKDWGTSFPEKYIWMQSNHFTKGTSLFLSIAKIPFAGMSFNGLISILVIRDRQYRFATYNGSRYSILKNNSEQLQIEVIRKKLRLVITANNTEGHILKAPSRGRMSDEITETLDASVNIKLYDGNTCIHEDNGTNLGYEMMWDAND